MNEALVSPSGWHRAAFVVTGLVLGPTALGVAVKALERGPFLGAIAMLVGGALILLFLNVARRWQAIRFGVGGLALGVVLLLAFAFMVTLLYARSLPPGWSEL